MTEASKTPIEIMLDKVDWKPVVHESDSSDLPYVTYEGVLNCMGMQLRVYVLNTGQRVIEESDLIKLFGGQVTP